MRTPKRIKRDDQVSEERHRIRQSKAVGFHRNETHQRWQDSSADNGHHEKRAAQLGVRSQALKSEGKDGWKHERHEKAGQENAPRTEPAGHKHRSHHKRDVGDAISSHQLARTDEAHEPRGGKAADPKSSQRTRQEISSDLFGLMSVLLNIRNEIAPGPRLRADVEKLCDHREQKMWIAEEVTQMSAVAGLILVLTVNGGEFRAQDKRRPDESDSSDDQIRFHNAQRFRSKVRFVGMACLLRGDLLGRQFDAGEAENVAYQGSPDRAEGIESLGKVQPAFRTILVP